jgi:hypothetical protein
VALTPLDEALRHQLATTFDHAGTSDPRFFDRYWFAAYDPEGHCPLVNVGIGSYLNMNVLDGFVAFVAGTTQHNLRLSSALRPGLFTADPFVLELGPLRLQVVEPFRHLKLDLDRNSSGLSAGLDWRASSPPHEESPVFGRRHGRVSQSYCRYNQVGTVDGWIELDGERHDVDRWWGGRDHSWGVRADVAGGEPITGDADHTAASARGVWSWLTFSTPRVSGHVQVRTAEDGSEHHEAALWFARDRDDVVVTSRTVELEYELHPGTRLFSRATYLVASAGAEWRIELAPIGRALVMRGMGYSMGYADGRGFGVWRGAAHEEHDRYDLRDVEAVVHPDGRIERPYHRDCAVAVHVVEPDGTVSDGTGHCAVLVLGPLPVTSRRRARGGA